MSKNKGKPSGGMAEKETDAGRKTNVNSGWPEEAHTQHVADATAKQPGNPLEPEEFAPGEGSGLERKAGAPD